MPPEEVVGPCGTLVLMHGRTVHSGSVNQRAGTVRIAAFADLQPAGLTLIERDPDAGSFWIDSRPFEEDVPPCDDAWAGWG